MIVGFAASLGLTPLTRQIAMHLGVVDKPVLARKIHTDNKPMMGGLAIFVAFAVSLFLFSPPQHIRELAAIILGAGMVALVGLLDDRFDLSVGLRFAVMGAAALVLVLAGIQIRLFGSPFLDVPATIIWVIALTNALNFLDNMDGLSAGLSAIGAGFALLIALSQGQILVSLLAAALLGSAIGFLVYNFNPASTFMGDMGALSLGFILGVIAIKLEFAGQPTLVSWMVPVFALAVPIFDINLVVWTRLAEGRKPWLGDKDHTSHRLMALGFTQRQTLFILYGAAVLFGFIGLLISAAPMMIALKIGIFMFGIVAVLYGLMIWIRLAKQ